MTQLCRAIYVSQAVGGAGASLLSIAEILGVSTRNNRRDRLTGVLLFHEGWFLQALEGGRPDVERLLGKLKADPRHRDIRILTFGPVEQRAFADWSMNQVTVTPRVAPLLAARSLSAMEGPEAFKVLSQAAALHPSNVGT